MSGDGWRAPGPGLVDPTPVDGQDGAATPILKQELC